MLKPTQWLGAISTYFFLFLAIWVILCNPPFNDFASPAIINGEASFDNGANWTAIITSQTGGLIIQMPEPENVTTNMTMLVRAQVTDNDNLDANSVMLNYSAGQFQMTRGANHYFTYEVTNPAAPMFFSITASDVKGNDPTILEFSLVS